MKKMLMGFAAFICCTHAFAGAHFDASKDTGITHTEGESSGGTAWSTTTTPASGDGVFTPYHPETTTGEDSSGRAWESITE